MTLENSRNQVLRLRGRLLYQRRRQTNFRDETTLYESTATFRRALRTTDDPLREYTTIVDLLRSLAWIARNAADSADHEAARRAEARRMRERAISLDGGRFAEHTEARYWFAAVAVPGLGGSLSEFQTYDALVTGDLREIDDDALTTLDGTDSSAFDRFGVLRLMARRERDGVGGFLTNANGALSHARRAMTASDAPRNVLAVAECLRDLGRRAEARTTIDSYLQSDAPRRHAADIDELEAIEALMRFAT